jgi:hypothetical protein
MNAQIASDETFDENVLNQMTKFSKEPPEVSSNWALTVEAVTPSEGIEGGCAQVDKLNDPRELGRATGIPSPPEVPTGELGRSSSLSLPQPIMIPIVTIKSKRTITHVFRILLFENLKDFIVLSFHSSSQVFRNNKERDTG